MMMMMMMAQLRAHAHVRADAFATARPPSPLPVAPDLPDLSLPVQLLHLLVLVGLPPPAALGTRPAVAVDPDAQKDDGEHQQDDDDADYRNLELSEERPKQERERGGINKERILFGIAVTTPRGRQPP